MIALKSQIIVGVIVILAVIVLINMVRRQQLELKYALSWFAVGVLVFLLDCFPVLMEKIAWIIGIASPVNMLFFFGFCFVLVLVFVLTYAVSKMSNRIKDLAQELALLKKKLNDEEEK